MYKPGWHWIKTIDIFKHFFFCFVLFFGWTGIRNQDFTLTQEAFYHLSLLIHSKCFHMNENESKIIPIYQNIIKMMYDHIKRNGTERWTYIYKAYCIFLCWYVEKKYNLKCHNLKFLREIDFVFIFVWMLIVNVKMPF